VAAVLVILVLITLSSSLLGGKVFTSGDNIFQWPPFSAEKPAGWVRPSNPLLSDPVLGFNPDLLQIRSDLRNGTSPLWNPYAAGGRPLLGSQQSGLLFPPNWLAFILPFWSSLGWIAAIKILLAAAGAYLLCRELALRRAASLLGAIAFAFGLYFFTWLEHPHTNVWAMLPWALFATRRLCTTGSLGATALLGASVGAAWLGGHPESAAFVLVTTLAYGTFELVAERTRGPARSTASLNRRTGLFIAGLVLGIGLGAVMSLPLVELLNASGKTLRGVPPYPFKAGLSFFFPELWGMPNKLYQGHGPANFNERTAYIGALPLLLALAGLGRRRAREQWFFVALAVILLATIFHTPVWASLIRKLPDSDVPAINRMLIVVSLCGAVLSAYGLDRWLGAGRSGRRQMLRIMGAVAAIPLLIWLGRYAGSLSHLPAALLQPTVHYSETSRPVVETAAAWRWFLLCTVGVGVLALVKRRRVAVGLVIALTAADLVTLDRGYHGSIPQAWATPPTPPAVTYLQAHQGSSRVLGHLVAFPADLAERYGLRDPRQGVVVPDTLRHRLLWTALDGLGGDQEVYNAGSPRAQNLADLFAVRYLLLAPGTPPPSWARPVLRTSAATVAVNPSAFPRAWVAYDWQRSSGRVDALRRTTDSPTPRLLSAPVIEGAPTPPTGVARTATPARIVSDGSESVTVQATAAGAGYLILDDSAYPGWQASVDGRAVPWYPADENFRAVPLRAGRHVIRFSYRPASALAGLIVSGACAIALLALALIGWRQSRLARGQG